MSTTALEKTKLGTHKQGERVTIINDSNNPSETETSKPDFVKKEELNKLGDKLEAYQKDLDRVDHIMAVVIIALFVSFLVGFYSLEHSATNDKSMYVKYDDLYEMYSNNNKKMEDYISKLEKDVIEYKHQIELLKVKNYLK